jgi:hypothetical protein
MIEPTLLVFFVFFTLTTLGVIACLYLLKKNNE